MLQLFLVIYCFSLLAVPETSIYALIVNGAAVALAMAADTAFLVFLQSRKPVEKTVLNRLLVVNFSFKILLPVYYFAITCIGYDSIVKDISLSDSLSTTIFSYASFKMMANLSFIIYIIISLSRLLLFISPSLFRSLNPTTTMLIPVGILVIYLITFQSILLPCEVDQQGNGVHRFAFAIFIETREAIIKRTHFINKCFIFPTVVLFCCILLVVESIRLAVAAKRGLIKSLEKNKVSAGCVNQTKYGHPLKTQSFSLPNLFEVSELNTPVTIRRLSLQLSREKDPPVELIKEGRRRFIHNNTDRKQDFRCVIKIIVNLISRTYYLIVLIISIALFSFLLPVSFYKVDRLHILFKLAKLDIYFVPVFWLLFDKAVWHFTAKNVKTLCRVLGMTFLG